MTTTAIEKLTAARSKIEQGWTQGSYAKDAYGSKSLWWDEKKAIAWCAVGALNAVEAFREADFIDRELPEGFEDIVHFNDHPNTTKADVLALFDRAIEKLRQQQADGNVG